MSELYIYGEIVGERQTFEQVSSRDVAYDLEICEGDLDVHLNSPGGDVFQAVTIYNLLKAYKGGTVNILIDGLCASAATLIMCAGNRITMARNALLMLHLPSVGMEGFYNEQHLEKIQNQLAHVKSIIIQTYQDRTGNTAESLEKLISTESWMTAKEALEAGFIDEVTDLVVTDCVGKSGSWAAFNNFRKAESTMDKNFLDKFIEKVMEKMGKDTKDTERLAALDGLKGTNAQVNAVIDVCKAEGVSVDLAQKLTKAAGSAESLPDYDKAAQYFADVLKAQLGSGQEGVAGSAHPPSTKEQAALIAKFANQ